MLSDSLSYAYFPHHHTLVKTHKDAEKVESSKMEKTRMEY